jgi:hypothetical protein
MTKTTNMMTMTRTTTAKANNKGQTRQQPQQQQQQHSPTLAGPHPLLLGYILSASGSNYAKSPLLAAARKHNKTITIAYDFTVGLERLIDYALHCGGDCG